MKRSAEEEQRLVRAVTEAAQILKPKEPHEVALRRLQNAYGSFVSALEAGAGEMQRVGGLSKPTAYALSLTPELARHILEARAAKIRRIRSLEDVRQHLLPLYLGMHYECGYMLCLNAQGMLRSTHMLRMGSVDEAPFYLRVIIETALNSGGELFILAHNHPGGTRRPSPADIESTMSVLEAMHKLELTLVDHVILADKEAVSMRACSQNEQPLWQSCAPLPKFLCDWPAPRP